MNKQIVIKKNVSHGDRYITTNLIVNGKTHAKVIAGILWFWIKPSDILYDKIAFRKDVFDEAISIGIHELTFVYDVKTVEPKTILTIGVEEAKRRSKKYEKRDRNNPRVMVNLMEIHLKDLHLSQGKPLWKKDPLQSNL